MLWNVFAAAADDGFQLVQAQMSTGADVFSAVWAAMKDATPPVALLLLGGLYYLHSVNKALQARNDVIQAKREELLEKFITMAGETNATLKEFRDLFTRLVRPPSP